MKSPKGILAFILLITILMIPSKSCANTSSVTTWVHIEVEERNEISILTRQVIVDKAIDGKAGRHNFFCKIAVTGNRPRKIMGRLAHPLPPDIKISMEIPSPGEGTSQGRKTLSMEPVMLVSGLSDLGEKELQGTLIFETDITACPSKGMTQIALALEYE